VPHILLSAALVVIVVLAPTAVAAETSEIDIRIDETAGVIVPVTIDGSGPFPFLLDTGSTHSVISGSLAERLAMRFVAKTSVLTSTGREWRPVVELNQTTIARARSERLLASVAPSAQLDSIARGIEGIIGQDFLFAFNYTLDYRRKRLTWHDGNSHNAGIRLPLVARGGRYLVQVTSPGEKAPLLLVPDSGANGFVMFAHNGRTRVPLEPVAPAFSTPAAYRFGEASSPQRTAIHSLSGGQDVRTMMMRELRLENAALRNQRVAVLERAPGDAVEGDGLLPLHVFASVTFNAGEGYLIVRF